MSDERMCADCGDRPPRKGRRLCNPCNYAKRPSEERTCADCGSSFTTRNRETRCSSCRYRLLRANAARCRCGAEKDARSELCRACYAVSEKLREQGLRSAANLHKERRTAAETVELVLAGAVRQPDGCLLATIGNKVKGYRRLHADGTLQMVHRLVFEEANGPIPDGFSVDHTCHNRAAAAGLCAGGPTCPHRACIEITHLEAVEPITNWERGTRGVPEQRKQLMYCPQGHPYDDANTYVSPTTGWRLCRACKRIKARERNRRAKES